LQRWREDCGTQGHPEWGKVSLAAEDAGEGFMNACEEVAKPMIAQKARGLLSGSRSRSFLEKTYEKEENL
jgi:hypothetical protein